MRYSATAVRSLLSQPVINDEGSISSAGTQPHNPFHTQHQAQCAPAQHGVRWWLGPSPIGLWPVHTRALAPAGELYQYRWRQGCLRQACAWRHPRIDLSAGTAQLGAWRPGRRVCSAATVLLAAGRAAPPAAIAPAGKGEMQREQDNGFQETSVYRMRVSTHSF
jgi:hypothetical protein